ncbi:competence type IV pilus assembly protein ComGB [Ligilactobacillus saerimneri]|uniref:competence type IV pilus assembly protein ComGB n=1 Tax=Ligilactobacillus saerimneri TaxID=228229 RepID=UPI001C0F828B|nr:competence type IV pilus assembly protein ComGB [Ligilactobacillus saerimneri]MBU5310084.1 type II secretion system F family protein [Ligilactobacillus saerimneri]
MRDVNKRGGSPHKQWPLSKKANPKANRQAAKYLRSPKTRLPLRQQVLFFSLLADLLQAGFQLQTALTMMQGLAPELKSFLTQINTQLQAGQSLGQALAGRIATNSYSQIMIAEKHGFLDQSLQQLGQLLTTRTRQKARLRALLAYPVALFVVIGGIIVAVKIWLFPQLTHFSNFDQTNFISWWLVLKYIGVVLLSVLVVYLLRVGWWWRKQGAVVRSSWYVSLPIIGKLYSQYSYYYLSFNIGMLLKSGMDLKQIREYLLVFDPASLFYQLGEQLERHINSGQSLSTFIRHYPFLPPELTYFIGKGQTLSQLGTELLVYSKLAYKKLLQKSERMMNYIQPLLFVIIACLIIGTYLAILLPLYHSLEGVYVYK